MRLATWNVNSVRSRVDRAVAFLGRSGVDVLALQETKCKDEQFPREAFEALGYRVATFGFSQWNGVAIVSRVGLDDVERGFPTQPTFGDDDPALEARAIGATCGGVRVWSLYVPHGRTVGHPHYAYKLRFLDRLREQARGWISPAGGDPTAQVALVGDWNVAPRDTDVWDLAVFADQTHITPPERDAFAAFEGAGYTEVTRVHVPQDRRYTYWDYQRLRFPRNEGMRIDFAYVSPAVAARTTAVSIERDERKGTAPSDHVPVVLELAD
ncbi:exodeoxyribonuclease III [Cellulomonas aerilata]|uniref:Putative exodeoxyribonuclease III protein XthA n=1 Tax=Cellulomonas aerilata TaxID=515326 RepID=A0A512D7D2_9CELL|nr:exodeoxyribonuclease III [Cellulomonas aerilata]GEO32297.1 putative exodeoxyribonuclease III protein XthA [Cellulomonas aerilata]